MTVDPLESEGVVFRDKRRIDPETGEVREPRPSATPAPPGVPPAGGSPLEMPVDAAAAAAAGPAEAEVALAERTADLQRLQAEYVNYKRRVERDRDAVREQAVATVLSGLLAVLDDIGRAREHGELQGGFKAVAESLERTVGGLGLQQYGQVGDSFDPRIHEALMHGYSDDVTGPVCQAVLQVGYRYGDRILRPARVAVAEPETVTAPPGEMAAEPAYDEDGSGGRTGDDV